VRSAAGKEVCRRKPCLEHRFFALSRIGALNWVARIWLQGGYTKAEKQKAPAFDRGYVLVFLVETGGIEPPTF